MKCIDLREVAGKRYRLEWDESRKGRGDDPWLLIVPCRYGHVYPHSAKLLGVATNGRNIGRKLSKLLGVEVSQEAEDGFNLTFPRELFAKVAKIVKARRRRQLSENELKKLSERGTANLKKRRLANVQSQN